MADEAFALSPISARAAQPSEADYDAIQEAFMETSRGRWFLGEYAKRNRNADTRMVLDAVARIEGTLAAQKQPERDPLLDQMMASFRAALTEARHAATTAVGDLALEQNLAPVRKGARVIREIAWRLREIGADGRICDLIDSQVGVIESAAGKLNSADLAAALHGAFDRIEEKIASFDTDGTAAAPQTAAHAEKPASVSETTQARDAHPIEAAAAHPAASDRDFRWPWLTKRRWRRPEASRRMPSMPMTKPCLTWWRWRWPRPTPTRPTIPRSRKNRTEENQVAEAQVSRPMTNDQRERGGLRDRS